MSGSKDKRIKKLKRKRIWPSVLGLFFIFILVAILTVAIVGSSFMDVVNRKFSQSYEQSAQIATLYADYDEARAGDINKSVTAYLNLSQDVEAVSVLDAADAVIWASGDLTPNMDMAEEVGVLHHNQDNDLKIVLAEGQEQIFSVEGGEIVFQNDFLKSINFLEAFNGIQYFTTENISVIEMQIWFVVPVNDLQICVLNHIHVYDYDLFMLALFVVLILVLISVFMLYYIISFISVIMSIRTTTKIIYTDMVTGGDNWLHFVKKGTTLLKRNRNQKNKYAMVHLKMRKYRSFCTCFGVKEGEDLIEKFYLALKKRIKRNETMAHRENAEFGVLITYTDQQQLTNRIAEIKRILDAVLPNMRLYFGVGVCLIEPGQSDVEQLYNNALLASEMQGEEAGEGMAFFNIEMNKQRLWERKVEDDMERALQNKEFKIYLQPKINTTEEKLAGAEALVRWLHPTEGFIPPNKFIPIFEQNGFILKLDDYMLEEVAAQQADWIAKGRRIVPISVNISRAHFTREDLAEHICRIVDKYQVPHDVIELELTESAFFDDKQVLLNTVKKLKNNGFIVSMDDFGAGYSSLNSLKELQIDVLKIDADFFRGVDSVERGMLIVSEVIDLAKKLNMKIVAEGIESREQVDFLTEQECDLIQGYFFAKPMPIEEFVEKYKED